MDRDKLLPLQQALVREWQIETADATEVDCEDQLLGMLRERIVHFLQGDMQKLLAAMYRLDISERDFNAAMRLGSVDKIADELALAVLKRQKTRMENRRRHNKGTMELGDSGNEMLK